MTGWYLADPWWLAALPLAALALLGYRRGNRGFLGHPQIRLYAAGVPGGAVRALMALGPAARVLACILLGLALARPVAGNLAADHQADGIDIIMAVDTSGSMEARDFQLAGRNPTRLEVIKAVFADFVPRRPDDRIGMVVFGTEAYTQAPLTLDHAMLLRFLTDVRIGMAGENTAIGDGLALSVKRLKDATARSKVVILLTDGANTAGRIEPPAAADAAKAHGVRVYTIGVGSQGEEPVGSGGLLRNRRLDLDEPLLKAIAATTGGRYFRARDTDALKDIYATIDTLEKTRQERPDWHLYDDRYPMVIGAALGLLALELLWSLSRYRRVP